MYALVTPFVKEPRLMRRSLPSMRGIQTTHCCENRAVFVATHLGALIAANERSREGAAPIRLYAPSDAVRRLLNISGVTAVLVEAEELPAA